MKKFIFVIVLLSLFSLYCFFFFVVGISPNILGEVYAQSIDPISTWVVGMFGAFIATLILVCLFDKKTKKMCLDACQGKSDED